MGQSIIIKKRDSRQTKTRDFQFSRDLVRDKEVSSWIKKYREEAWNAYNDTSIPTKTMEAWRRTDLKGLQADMFKLLKPGDDANYLPVPEKYLRSLTSDTHGGRVLVLPDKSSVNLDEEISQKGVIFTDLQTAEIEYPDLLDKVIGRIVRPEDGKFASLAGAFARNGVFLYVPKNTHVDQPLHSLLWGPGAGMAHVSHVLIFVDEGASVTYLHESASPTELGEPTFHAGNVEIYVGRSANLKFVEFQSWGLNTWNFSHERAHVDQDGNLDWIFGSVGSHLTKNFSDLVLIGSGSSGRMSGFYFGEKDQHLDHDTMQHHMAPHTTSDMLFKGALTGKSRSVWRGMIYVAPGAYKSDGYQANRNLILSPDARADSIPGLEILTDDVRCTHGATVGKIDEGEIFYLMSRGIPRKASERILTEGFFDPIMQRIPYEGVRNRLFSEILEKMD